MLAFGSPLLKTLSKGQPELDGRSTAFAFEDHRAIVTGFKAKQKHVPLKGDKNRVCTWRDEAKESHAPYRRSDPTATSQCASRETRDSIQPDPETGVAPGFTRCRNMRSRCRCSMCPAIHINSRSWLRSSSTHEPSDPPLRVIFQCQPFLTTAAYCVQTCNEAGKRQ